jgi:hypothetical protein
MDEFDFTAGCNIDCQNIINGGSLQDNCHCLDKMTKDCQCLTEEEIRQCCPELILESK